jgi:hypothetical protein
MEFPLEFLTRQGVAIASGQVLGSVHLVAVPGPVAIPFGSMQIDVPDTTRKKNASGIRIIASTAEEV